MEYFDDFKERMTSKYGYNDDPETSFDDSDVEEANSGQIGNQNEI